MSRTVRVNVIYSRGKDRKEAICPDGKQRWKCKCAYCILKDYHKALNKIHNTEIKDS